MGDGVALFDAASHANHITPGTAINVENLGIARKTLRLQTGVDQSTVIDITPKFLVTPASLETVAGQYLAQLAAATATDVNPFSGRLQLVVEPELDAASATAWFLFGSPDQAPVLEYAHLEGAESVEVRTRAGWERLGVEFRAVLSYGVGCIGYRGVARTTARRPIGFAPLPSGRSGPGGSDALFFGVPLARWRRYTLGTLERR